MVFLVLFLVTDCWNFDTVLSVWRLSEIRNSELSKLRPIKKDKEVPFTQRLDRLWMIVMPKLLYQIRKVTDIGNENMNIGIQIEGVHET